MIHLRTMVAILFWLLATFELHAQESVPATGGDGSGSGGSTSYTIGQVVYTETGTNGSVSQGVQQPYEISTTIGIEVTEIKLDLVAYPNPTNSAITLNVGNYNNEKLTYQLYDMQGKLLANKQVINSRTSIDLQDLPVSAYLLNVLDNNSLIKTFSIIKN